MSFCRLNVFIMYETDVLSFDNFVGGFELNSIVISVVTSTYSPLSAEKIV